MRDLAPRVLAGERLALSRALTRVENETADARDLLAALFPHTGRAHVIGITGAPGAGKSTLVNALARALRRAGETVAIVAVDPTSPFTGGAILGDRVRMNDLARDPGVFIRSVASRGNPGGLARTTADLVIVLDAYGFERVLIETVGAGQSEVEVARTAHTTVLVEAPGLGDEIQAVKAGILEIADVLVLNKADLPGAAEALRVLRTMLPLATAPHGGSAVDVWQVRLLATTAADGGGVDELVTAVTQHRAFLQQSGELERRRRARVTAALETRLRERLYRQLLATVGPERFAAAVEDVLCGKITPETAVANLLEVTQSNLTSDK